VFTRSSGVPYLVGSGVLWGAGGVTGSLLGRSAGLGGLAVAGYRIAVGGALIVAYLLVSGRRLPAGQAAWARVGVVGALAALFQGAYFGAVALTSVSLATLVTIGTAPVLVLLAERVAGVSRLDRGTVAVVGLALAGLALLVGTPGDGGRGVPGGAALAVLAAAGFAAVTLVGTRPVPGLDALTTVGTGFVLGGAVLLPLAAATTGVAFHPGPGALALLAVLGTGPTAVAYTLYFRGLPRAGATTAAVLTLLEPLTATVLAAVALHDHLRPAAITGAALLVTALLARAVQTRPAPAAEPPRPVDPARP
jgi:drug/metabolite transporter, DME family